MADLIITVTPSLRIRISSGEAKLKALEAELLEQRTRAGAAEEALQQMREERLTTALPGSK